MKIDDLVRQSLSSADVRRLERTFSKEIIFQELNNGNLALIDRKKRWIYFPEDFEPALGRSYKCSVYVTVTGVYKYQGESYRVCRAHLATNESIPIDSYRPTIAPKTESPFAAALKGFEAQAYVERHTVRAERNPKSNSIDFKPIYVNKDPDFGDQPTMYFLTTDTTLVEGKEYTVSVESKHSTGRYNRRNALMVRVKVTIK